MTCLLMVGLGGKRFKKTSYLKILLEILILLFFLAN